MNSAKALRRIVIATAVALTVIPAEYEAGAQAPTTVLSWHNTGDSYASGEGVSGNEGACSQSRNAFGPLAAADVREAGWTVGPEAFTACTGHLVEDFLNPRPESDKSPLAAWARKEQGLTEGRADVLTVSFGGNDIGFAEVVMDCLPTSDWVVGGIVGGCDTSEADLIARVDALVSPTRSCTGGRWDGGVFSRATRRDRSFDWGCDLLLDDRGTPAAGDDRRGSLVEFYRLLVDEHLTARGQLYVVGYPAMFAPTAEWPARNALACATVRRGDAEKLARVSKHFNDKLLEAVTAADGGRDRIHFISRYDLFRSGGHELCGSGPDWLNGISKNRGTGIQWARYQTSFHPNAEGHIAVAEAIAADVTSRDWTTEPPVSPALDWDGARFDAGEITSVEQDESGLVLVFDRWSYDYGEYGRPTSGRELTWTRFSLSVQVASVCRSRMSRQVVATSAGVR